MKIDTDVLRAIVHKANVNGATPPRLVYQAFASLLGEVPAHLLTVMQKGDDEVTWQLLGMTSRALVLVRASHAGAEWSHDSESGEVREGRLLEARLIPLREVVSCGVTNVRSAPQYGFQSETIYEWIPDWSITLRDGSVIDIPTRERSEAQSLALVTELISHLTSP